MVLFTDLNRRTKLPPRESPLRLRRPESKPLRDLAPLPDEKGLSLTVGLGAPRSSWLRRTKQGVQGCNGIGGGGWVGEGAGGVVGVVGVGCARYL